MKDALFIGFTWKLLLIAGAGGGNGNKEEVLKEMADGMKSIQKDFRDWGLGRLAQQGADFGF